MKFKSGRLISLESLSVPCARDAKLKSGYLLSLEAVTAVFLLLIAASSLPLFRFQEDRPQDFFLCSDAAIVLSKSHAFADGSLQEKVQTASELSGLCIEAYSPLTSASSCEGEGADAERYAFTVPIWQSGALQEARVSCWGDR